MLKGLPASGKSTWARDAAARDRSVVRVNKDDLRSMCHDGNWDGKREKTIIAIRDAIIEACLSRGQSVIVDDTNFQPAHETRLRELAAKHDAKFGIKVFDVDVETCVERDAKRPRPVGEQVIRQMYRAFVAPQPTGAKPWLFPAIIVDVDGTLADMGDRDPYRDDLAGRDMPREDVISVVRALAAADPALRVIVMSGRDEGRAGTVTQEWLIRHKIPHDMLLMRKAGDTRKDSIIKRELFDAHIAGRYFVRLVLDDRDQVVRMWRDDLGLPCHQVNWGNF